MPIFVEAVIGATAAKWCYVRLLTFGQSAANVRFPPFSVICAPHSNRQNGLGADLQTLGDQRL